MKTTVEIMEEIFPELRQLAAAEAYLNSCKAKDNIRARRRFFILLPIFFIVWAYVAYTFLF